MSGFTVVRPYQRADRHPPGGRNRRNKAGAIRLSPGLLDTRLLVAAAALVLLARLQLFGELCPFGFAFWAAGGRQGAKRAVVLGGVLVLVSAAAREPLATLSLLLAMALFWLFAERLAWLKFPLPVLAGLSLLAGSLPRLWLGFFHVYDVVLMGLETALAMLATAIFGQVLAASPAKAAAGEDLEGAAAWVVTLGLILLALVQEGRVLAQLAGALARLLVLWAAFWLGPGLAAAAGALLGFLLGIQGGGLMWLSILTFAGLMAGLFRPYGRLAQAVGFFLGSGSLALYLDGWPAVCTEAPLAGAAALIFLVCPVLPRRFRLLASIFSQEQGAEDIRKLASTRIRDYAHVFRELADAFRQASAGSGNEPALATLAGELASRVCRDCVSYRRCWEKDSRRAYSSILQILSAPSTVKGDREERAMDFARKYCRRKEDFLSSLRLIREIGEINGRWQQKIDSLNGFVSDQLLGLSQILLELGREVNCGRGAGQAAVRPQFHVEIGVAQVPEGDGEVCGDYYSYLELRDGRQAFILSDGMGNGSKARQESSSTVGLVEQLLLAGFHREQVIKTVNTILQLRSRAESFATLDAVLVDTQKGEAEFLKIGAAPSYLRQRGEVAEIKSPSVPLGILSEVELKAVSMNLEDGAIIVMVTDGVNDALPHEPDWLKSLLASTDLEHPQVLADEIIRQAKARSGKKRTRDDLTVLVCHIRRLRHRVRDCLQVNTPASSN